MRNTTILRGAAQALGLELLQVESRIEQLTLEQLDKVIELLRGTQDGATQTDTLLIEVIKNDNKVEIFVTHMEDL